MTEYEYILARLQVEREQSMARWNVPGFTPNRVLPREPKRALAEHQARQHDTRRAA